MNKLVCFFIILMVLSCGNKEHVYQYYVDGKIKIDAEVVNRKRNGVLLEYYGDGTLKSRQYWENDMLNGPFIDYYPDGKIFRKGHLENFEMVEMTFYYRTGGISEVQHYDLSGDIFNAERYKEDGMRDSIPFPFLYILNSDTIKKGDTGVLKCKILNTIDTAFKSDKFIVTSAFDSSSKTGTRIKDTLDVIYPRNNLFEYKFDTNNPGVNTIYGELIFRKDRDDKILVMSHKFGYPYYVRD